MIMLLDEISAIGCYISCNATHTFWSRYYLQMKAVFQL
jgi:hypothetical protein